MRLIFGGSNEVPFDYGVSNSLPIGKVLRERSFIHVQKWGPKGVLSNGVDALLIVFVALRWGKGGLK